MRRRAVAVVLFLCTTGFDQASKEWATRTLPPGVRQPVIHGYWDWELAQNPGAAFSSFTGVTGAQILLALLALIALIAIGVMAARTRPDQKLKLAALAMIGGGALGNLLDRVRAGEVTDFVRWHIHEHLWPIFNVADAALLIGVLCLAIDSLLQRRRAAANLDAAD